MCKKIREIDFLPKIKLFLVKIDFTNFFAHFSYFRALCLRRNSIAAVAENWYQLYRIDICYLWSHKNSEKKIDKFVVTVIIGKLWIISIKCRRKNANVKVFLFSIPYCKTHTKNFVMLKNTIHAEIFISRKNLFVKSFQSV